MMPATLEVEVLAFGGPMVAAPAVRDAVFAADVPMVSSLFARYAPGASRRDWPTRCIVGVVIAHPISEWKLDEIHEALAHSAVRPIGTTVASPGCIMTATV